MNYCQFRNDFIKRMCNSVKPLLPSEYQQVEYIEGTGTQYISTGTIPAALDVLFIDFQLTNITDEDNVVTYIDNGTSQNNAYGFSYSNNRGTEGFVCGWSDYTTVRRSDYSEHHSIEITNGIFKLDGNVIATKSGSITFNKPLYVAAWNRNNTVAICGKVRIYRFTLTGTNSGKLDLIPCYRKADNKPGMYDLVTETFFTNAGTGEFTVGQDV